MDSAAATAATTKTMASRPPQLTYFTYFSDDALGDASGDEWAWAAAARASPTGALDTAATDGADAEVRVPPACAVVPTQQQPCMHAPDRKSVV